ncbi:MAG TPA: response regulator transcription factor [Longimicrobium sp.]|nr:response regulator transcription factor [Longimicrobium sp.]
MSKRSRVLLADDHTLVAEGLGSLLREEFELVGQASDGRALLRLAAALKPDVVVTDITMPLLNGVDAIRELHQMAPETRVVVVTMHADPRLAAEAVRAGATGYVLKHSAGQELIHAVREVSCGRLYITPLIAHDVISVLAGAPASPDLPHLTSRQRQVLQLVAEGHSMKRVAAMLNVSRRTAETHKYQLMSHLDVHSTAGLVQAAFRMGLLSLESPSPHAADAPVERAKAARGRTRSGKSTPAQPADPAPPLPARSRVLS